MNPSHTILIGTTKGLFLADSTPARTSWKLRGPFCRGWTINHAVGDAHSGRMWAGGGGDFFGAGVWRTDDGGETWDLTRLTRGSLDDWADDEQDFARSVGWTGEPLPFEDEFSQIWSLNYAHGQLLAGTKPAQLLHSRDNGRTFTKNAALAEFTGRDAWNGGGAGLTLHTLVPDPDNAKKLWLGISAAGVFATQDGGESWERRNRLSNAESCGHHDHPAAPRDGETGHCVHNMMLAPGGGELLYQQNHHGVWRSVNGGRSWDDINAGLPSTFGFPLRVHPHDPDKIWTIPLADDFGRFPLDQAMAVWHSDDAGQTWQAQRNGLPQTDCFFTILRQAFAGDTAEEPGLYFGTNSGSVFASTDGGATWAEILRHLPTILSVEVMEH